MTLWHETVRAHKSENYVCKKNYDLAVLVGVFSNVIVSMLRRNPWNLESLSRVKYLNNLTWYTCISLTRLLSRPQPQMYPPVALNQYTWVNWIHNKHFRYASRPHKHFWIKSHTPKLSSQQHVQYGSTSKLIRIFELKSKYEILLLIIFHFWEVFLTWPRCS